MIMIEVIILSSHTVPVEVLINIENVSEKPRPNSVDRLYICKIKRHEAETIKAATHNINNDTSLFTIPRSIFKVLSDRSEFTNNTRVRSILDNIIWLNTIPTIVDWETNNGALINASAYEVIDSSESLGICIDISPSC
jgi:hypothetical protein